MQKIGDITPTANADGEYREGNPAAGVGPTLVKAAWLNTVQRELINAIVGLGVELDPASDSQLFQALQKLSGDTADWDVLKHRPPALLAMSRITSISANTALTAAQMGLVLIDANAATRTITLPTSAAALGVVDVIVRRTDNSTNRLVVQAAGTDKIKFHTHLNAAGYPFLVLMGSGDWWHLRSDGNGGWWPVGRFDGTSLGRPVFETTTSFSPGGYGPLNSREYLRSEWPWLWDHGQQSGMLTTEAARVGMEGGWTSGDGIATFRAPEGRAEFIRVLDDGRGVDSGRLAGSWAVDLLRAHGHNIDSPSNPTAFGTGKIARGNRSDVAGLPGSELYGGIETRPRSIAYPGRIKII
ncbi:phage tail protein [Pseudomonas sp. P9_31]|uniref:phage tail protein n=1 Tax=Pseudomonas sp. P9_31 TaxID=3043448 RepID=UPI002A361E0E|nr:phage tail protein [Pseudomonas sp. P9_31]WPN56704.1 phage tail protein [Pseudomonas sp. P9_31]